MGLSAAELEAFNAELDEVNAITQTVVQDLSKEKMPTLESSREHWNHYKSALSEEAASALGKIASAALSE